METKKKILDFSTKYFNNHSYGSTSIQELATAMGISRGNFTYHFKDKDILLEEIANDMWEKIKSERAKSRQFPSFENLHNEAQLYYQFQKKYAFIFLDTFVLNHPKIKTQFRKMTIQTIEDNKASIAFSIKAGNMTAEPVPGLYNNLAFICWMLTFYWLSQQTIRGIKKVEDGEKMIWSILSPHFTKKGLKRFKDFFGSDYYEELGNPFEASLENIINF